MKNIVIKSKKNILMRRMHKVISITSRDRESIQRIIRDKKGPIGA